MNPVVVADDVAKRYGETVALDGASLSIDAGEVFALIGPNGAGKTTLVRALTGTVSPDSGSVSVLGASPTDVDASRLGVLPQSFSPPDRLSARELLAYYASLYPESRDPDTVLAEVGLADSAETWYENLSGGQQRRACVGSTLLNDPDVLVLDEPTTGIDPAGRRTIHRLIEDLAAAGTTVLLTTHDMAEAERLADRVGLLADGSVLDVGSPAALVDRHAGSDRLVVDLAETGVDAPAMSRARDESVDGDAPSSGDDPVATAREILPNRIERDRSRLVVHDVDPTDIGSVADDLSAAGVEYTGLRWTEPGLEAVYYALADAETDAEPGGPNTVAGEASAKSNPPISDTGGGRP
ncbi:ABC-type multidrug transport system, ATPase component [Halovivax ruber XH-70]|uniref:ABC-type multidrug transport system, ATPase component n=1 Tax=Halovivax ruber (strain DSM 18193 / JCM 13892 / XH-70) TaxID=797302 RepID=L0ID44_HALRX|nr:ABC transporter ATP-binding protein [Halovivax ruber]AGB15867.1 ABC-type multidrug transport system, ATPase component [Halovivax ruber XH-70]